MRSQHNNKYKARLFRLTTALFGIGMALSIEAIGLGDIQVQGVLNQPFHATIPLSDLGSLNPQDVKVKLASLDKYNEMGIDRAGYLSHFQFSVDDSVANAPKVVVTSDVPIDDPIVNILMVVSASNTVFYREYTVFLDPNTSTYANSAITPQSNATTKVSASSSHAKRAASPALKNGWYGPTAHNETLWHIASRYRPANASVEQTAVAIYQSNSSAFINGDINKLKSGVSLQIPSNATVRAVSQDQAQQILYGQPAVTEPSSATTHIQASASLSVVPAEPSSTPSATADTAATSTPPVSQQPTASQPNQANPATAAPMVLTSPNPQEATVAATNNEQSAVTTTANADATAKMKEQLDSEAKALQTEQATNQLLMTQMKELQQRNEELQHDLTDKDTLLLNLQALLNQKQQAQTGALATASQGGALPAVQSEESSSWGLWLSLVILLAAAGAAYWKREDLLPLIAAQKKALEERLGRSTTEDEDEARIEEAIEESKAEKSSVATPVVESSTDKASSPSSAVAELSQQLLRSVDEYMEAKRYNKAELELNIFLSHYPHHVAASLKLLEVYALTKKKFDFDRILRGLLSSEPMLSAEMTAKIAALQQTDWQITPAVEVNAELTKEESILSLDEEDSITDSSPEVEVAEKEVKKEVPESKPAEVPPVTEKIIEKSVATDEKAIPEANQHLVQDAKSSTDEHNIDFVQGLGSGFQPAIRDVDSIPVENEPDSLENDMNTAAPKESTKEESASDDVDDVKDGAKLDLSETYYSMGEYGAARKLLEDVLTSKTSSRAQREKAQQSLNKIESEHQRRHTNGHPEGE